MGNSASDTDHRIVVVNDSGITQDFAEEVKKGLLASPKSLPCKYFYDETGSKLFEEICTLHEYYIPRAEREILERHSRDIAKLFPAVPVLVELGCGNAEKTRILIEAFLDAETALRYVPIDISSSTLKETCRKLKIEYPAIEITAIAADYNEGLKKLKAFEHQPKLIIWLGSNIGNFDRKDAAEFIAKVRQSMNSADRFIVGIDMRKHKRVLELAYDDPKGVTAKFNMNILARINKELGANFDLSNFKHKAVYNEDIGRIEMYLVCTGRCVVNIANLGLDIPFLEGETIHTENSYKYSVGEIRILAKMAGMNIEHMWMDGSRRFCETLLAPA